MKAQAGLGGLGTIVILIAVVVALSLLVGHLLSITNALPPTPQSVYSGTNGGYAATTLQYSGLQLNGYINYSVVGSAGNCYTGSCGGVSPSDTYTYSLYILTSQNSTLGSQLNAIMMTEINATNAQIAAANAGIAAQESCTGVGCPPQPDRAVVEDQYSITAYLLVQQTLQAAIQYNIQYAVTTSSTSTSTSSISTSSSSTVVSSKGLNATTTIIAGCGTNCGAQAGFLQGFSDWIAQIGTWLSNLFNTRVST